MKRATTFIILAAALVACTPKPVVKTSDGNKIKVEAVSENIIRVQTVSADAEFSAAQSLSSPVETIISKDGDLTIFNTPKIVVSVDKKTGAVTFFGADGSEYISDGQGDWVPDGTVPYPGLAIHTPYYKEESSGQPLWAEVKSDNGYYLILGDSLDQIINRYRVVCGKVPVAPKWAMGLWQNRENDTERELDPAAMAKDANNGTSWEALKAQISNGLNFSLSGIPYWIQDIGGTSADERFVAAQQYYDRQGLENRDLREWRELQARWCQFGAFTPLFRVQSQWPGHGILDIAPQWHKAHQSILYYINLRNQLMPYIYTMAGRVHFAGYTMMRPLVMDYPEDPAALNVTDQYMFGDALLVCPVYAYGQRERQVFLPEDGWYDFYTGRFCKGGQTITVAAPYERIPIFARAGQIVPMGPDQEWTSQAQTGQLNIRIYDGWDADYTLYEDDGVSYAYGNGAYSLIDMEWHTGSRRFVIMPRKGSYDGMILERDVTITVISTTAQKTKKAHYDGHRLVVEF